GLVYWGNRDEGTGSTSATPSPSVAMTTPAAPASPTAASESASPGGASATPTTTAAATASASPSGSAVPSPSPTPSTVTISVPNVVGEKASSAQQILTDAGFSTITCKDPSGNVVTALDGYVVTAQTPEAGTAVPADTPINLSCKPSSGGKG
ncbi:PASTA domain-containing protein, partial [Hamadaea sp. NPDC051192]|uniref:PASTA domain-containing protein n=1 Tax=Hamadaea sp. NPDC051192 TaxID=3154940 RepID=UPI00343D0D6F